MSSKARRQRLARLKKRSAYKIGAEVGRIESNWESEAVRYEHVVAVYRCAVAPNGRRLIWVRDRAIRGVQLRHGTLADTVRSVGIEPMVDVKQGDRVPTIEEQTLKMLKEIG